MEIGAPAPPSSAPQDDCGDNDDNGEDPSCRVGKLEQRVVQLEAENERLREQLSQRLPPVLEPPVAPSSSTGTILPESLPVDATKDSLLTMDGSPTTTAPCVEGGLHRPVEDPPSGLPCFRSPLSSDQITRYSRQILAGLGVAGQVELLKASVLVIGAGGIGSSCLLYLAGAGIGRMGIVDGDVVEVTNLHRQVIHSTDRVGLSKAVSAQQAVLLLNPTVSCHAYEETVTHDNALDLFSNYDIIVDATDNPQTRYLINDACVFAEKPLVFASALGTEGQVSVFHFRQSSCYRCLYPHPQATKSCASCADAGVLGPIPGLVGVLQATEVIKIVLSAVPDHPWNTGTWVLSEHLLQYDGLAGRFYKVKKPPRNRHCPVCSSDNATIRTLDDSRRNLQNTRGPSRAATAAASVGLSPTTPNKPEDELSSPSHQEVSVVDYAIVCKQKHPHILLDVREPVQYELCHLPNARSIPLADLSTHLDNVVLLASVDCSDSSPTSGIISTESRTAPIALPPTEFLPVYCLCRRGVASAAAAELLQRELYHSRQLPMEIYSIAGGLTAWHLQVDPSFPVY